METETNFIPENAVIHFHEKPAIQDQIIVGVAVTGITAVITAVATIGVTALTKRFKKKAEQNLQDAKEALAETNKVTEQQD